ncbi:MAG TPA: 23S rRNA (uracil(1939)-C(5))-methyltransferase RlmD [Thermoleophilia bacterium]|nr:23S rRNA (uracil(1939)-C(5))-methyltransferase RlmD [Thermoleophilia bacterium]
MPPRPGDIFDLPIDTLAYGGQGIGRLDGFVVFVRDGLPGDVVRVEVTRRKAGYAEATLIELLSPSPQRVPFRCDHAPDAGGCQWQVFDYDAQLEFKRRQVVEAFEHIGGLDDVTVEPVRGMNDPWRYRNKMEYSFGEADGALVLGMHRRGSWRDVVDVPDCHLAPLEISRARQAVLTACRALGLPAYSQTTHQGLLRHLVVRRARATGKLLVNLFVTGRFAEERRLAERVAGEVDITSFAVTVNATKADAAVGEGPFMIAGPPWFHEELAGVTLRVPALAFLQTNSEMCGVLYETALRRARPQAGRGAYDLYCGIGGLSLLLARQAGQVYGLEIQGEAIAAADENARLAGVGNVSFTAGDVRTLLLDPPTGRDPAVEALVRADGKPHQSLRRPASRPFDPPAVVLTDPPRAGMSKKAVERMALLGADRLVYVSCNPTTLAANAAQLAGLGYRLETVTPVDMFPHTHHIEAVADFVKTAS